MLIHTLPSGRSKQLYYLFSVQANNVRHLERYKRQLSSEELLNLSPEELCKDRLSEEYFRLTTEGDCRDVVRYLELFLYTTKRFYSIQTIYSSNLIIFLQSQLPSSSKNALFHELLLHFTFPFFSDVIVLDQLELLGWPQFDAQLVQHLISAVKLVIGKQKLITVIVSLVSSTYLPNSR